jgi:hypothetical protein
MKQLFKSMFFFGIAAISVSTLRADDWDLRFRSSVSQTPHIIEIQEAVEIPNGILSPGSYVFTLFSTTTDRHVVCVYDGRQHLLATILAIPNPQLQFSANQPLSFWERSQDSPKAVRAWFVPNGLEFVYPPAQAARIAAHVHQPVPTGALKPHERTIAPSR